MNNIVIIGAGGMGKEVAWLIEKINSIKPIWNILGFTELEKNSELFGKNIYNYPVLGKNDWLKSYGKEIYVASAIGKGSRRMEVNSEVSIYPNVKLATLISPDVEISDTVYIGEGVIIFKGCKISIDICIGNGVFMNFGTTIGHDCKIENYCTFLSNSIASGNAHVGECCEIGSGSFIMQGTSIVSNTILAPLSSVIRDIAQSGVYSGNPARRIL